MCLISATYKGVYLFYYCVRWIGRPGAHGGIMCLISATYKGVYLVFIYHLLGQSVTIIFALGVSVFAFFRPATLCC